MNQHHWANLENEQHCHSETFTLPFESAKFDVPAKDGSKNKMDTFSAEQQIHPKMSNCGKIMSRFSVENVSLVSSAGPSALSALIVALDAPLLSATVCEKHQH